MSIRCLVSAVVFASALAAPARADTVTVYNATLELPDEGWTMKTGPDATTLSGPERGHAIELFKFSAVPTGDKAAFAEILSGKPAWSEIDIEAVNKFKVGDAKIPAVAATGSAKLKGTPIRFILMSMKTTGGAITALSMVDTKLATKIFPVHERIVRSIRPVKKP